jgi:hypothetical protein
MTDREEGIFWGLVIGVLVTPVTFFLAVLSMGGGDYGFLKVFYPCLMLLMKFGGIDGGAVGLWGLLQFPIYGVIIGASKSRRRAAFSAALIFFVHLTAVCVCFWQVWWGR